METPGTDLFPDLQFCLRFVVHSLLETEILLDVLCKSVVVLSVSRDGLLLTGCRVDIHVVISAVMMQNTTRFRELADRFSSLHTTISLV